MKTKRLMTLLIIVLLGTLGLTACDGTLEGDLNLEELLKDRSSLNNEHEDNMNDDMNDDDEDMDDEPSESKQSQETKK